MIRRKKPIKILIIVLAIVICGIGVAYAALSSVLNITTSRITQSAMTWDIGFEAGTIPGVATVTNNGTINCGSVTATATAVTGVSPVFNTATGKCAYTLKLQNNGTIGGKIAQITITQPVSNCTLGDSSMTCGNMAYRLRYDSADSTSYVKLNDTIAGKSGSTPTVKTIVLTIENNALSTTGYNQYGFKYQLDFVQN
ncbi:MAG: hypothetical protein IKE63_03515 [Bacilli bacterium]|nr:hypothetical protein [Bacilli bacterium]